MFEYKHPLIIGVVLDLLRCCALDLFIRGKGWYGFRFVKQRY